MAKRDNAADADKTAETPAPTPAEPAAEATSTPSVPSGPPPTGKTGEPSVLKAEKLMYMGPTLVEDGHIFNHGQLFNHGLPDEWKAKAAADADFRMLLAPFARVAKATAALQDKNSALSAAGARVWAAYAARKAKKREAN